MIQDNNAREEEGIMARRAAIGITEFDKLIENNYFYVDKTGFIKEWWESGDEVTLFTRPRRFGKTLFMNMVEQFLSIKYADRGNLFHGLSIWQEETYRKLQGTYPVISLSFAGIKKSSYQSTYNAIQKLIAREFNRCYFLLDGGCLTLQEKDAFLKIASGQGQEEDIATSLNQLSEYLLRYYGKRTVILLDEYDTPMQEAYVNGYWDSLAEFTRGLFETTFKNNPCLERGILTGITRISKESLFSGLNNLEVATVTSQKYAAAFGFTEDDVLCALEEFGLKDREDDVKNWYDGYRFGDCKSIYNPWSIINFLGKKKLSAYWANTSSNQLAGDLIQKGTVGIKQLAEDLLNGKSICVGIDEETVFDSLYYQKDAVWGLLLASGYLKVDGFRQNRKGKREYMLSLTNLEVREVFDRMFSRWLDSMEYPEGDFSDALLDGDLTAMDRILNDILISSISFYDSGAKPSKSRLPENFYHGLVLGLIASLRNLYAVTSNRESGFGRYDVLLEPLTAVDDAIILEFKVHDGKKGQDMEATVDAAIQQILHKQYAAALEAKGICRDRIRIYGFAFEGKRALAGGGKLEAYEA